MTRRQKISIDIDDVIADSTEALRLLVNERTGVSLSREDYVGVGGEYWGYYERVWRAFDIHDRISFKEVSAEMAIDQSHVPLLPGAQFAIHELARQYHLIFTTARDKTWETETRRWLHEQFGYEDIELYFCENHKDAKAKTKGQLCKELGVMLHIDDNESHCQSVLDEGLAAILFGEYGWHKGGARGAIACKDWPQVLEHVGNAA